jgi:hypothetical protein
MVNWDENPTPLYSQFLKSKPKLEDNDGFITQGRKKKNKSEKNFQQKTQNWKDQQKIGQQHQSKSVHENSKSNQKFQSSNIQLKTVHTNSKNQNSNAQSKTVQENVKPFQANQQNNWKKPSTNYTRIPIPSSPLVGASRSYASVTKNTRQQMTSSIIDVETYTKKVEKDMLKINGAIATNEEKAIIAKELLGLTRKEMISITEPKGKNTILRFKLNVCINIQEKFVGKDLLQIPRKKGEEPIGVLFCKIVGVQNEQPQEPPTTVTISHLDCENPKEVISKLMSSFGEVVSEPEEILFGENAPEILIGVGSGNYKVDVKINQRPPEILAFEGNQILLSFKGMKKMCFRCFGQGHAANVCKKDKASWSEYKNFLREKFSMSSEFTGIQNEESENKEDFESSTQMKNQKDGAINLDITMEETEQDITVIEEKTFKETATSTPKVSPIKMATLIKQCKIEGSEDHNSKKGKAVRSDLVPPSKSSHERVCKTKTSLQHEKLQK